MDKITAKTTDECWNDYNASENELKKSYIDCIEILSYDFSLEEIERIYQMVAWKWCKSPYVDKKYKAMIEENRRTGVLN